MQQRVQKILRLLLLPLISNIFLPPDVSSDFLENIFLFHLNSNVFFFIFSLN